MSTFGAPDSLFGSPGTFGGGSSSTYPDFYVKLWNGDFSYTVLPGVDVYGYNWSASTDLGLIGTTDANGKLAGGAVAASDGDLLRFRVEDDGHGRTGFNQIKAGSSQSMDIVLRPSPGLNLVLRPQARPAFRSVPTVIPAEVEIFWLVEGEPISAAQSLGRFPIGPQIQLKVNPPADKAYWIIPMPYNAFGVPGYASLTDVPEANRTLIDQNRNSGRTVISQYGNSGDTSITLKVSGYGIYDHYRWVRSADDSSVQQVETLSVTVTTVTAGTLVVTVTANGMTHSPKVVNVTLAGGETDAQVAALIRAALAADADVNAFFTISGSTTSVIGTAIQGVANDATMSFVITASHGVNGATSANTTAGVAGFSINVVDSFVDLTNGIADPTFFFLTRPADTGVITRYVKVAHSSKGLSGPWGAFSNVLAVMYSHSGSGGGTAPSDPTPPDRQPFGFGA